MENIQSFLAFHSWMFWCIWGLSTNMFGKRKHIMLHWLGVEEYFNLIGLKAGNLWGALGTKSLGPKNCNFPTFCMGTCGELLDVVVGVNFCSIMFLQIVLCSLIILIYPSNCFGGLRCISFLLVMKLPSKLLFKRQTAFYFYNFLSIHVWGTNCTAGIAHPVLRQWA